MRIADFIEQNSDAIVRDAMRFTATLLPAARHLDEGAMRDHLPMILQAVVVDLRSVQTEEQELTKSLGLAASDPRATESPAQTHALLRAKAGFEIEQMVAEYRALRASVLRLWRAVLPSVTPDTLAEVIRFNEAIDQAIAESVKFFSAEADRWRHVFLAVLGHDLRGPLNAVLLTAELLARLGTSAPVGDYTQRLIQSGRRMKQLLDSLLDYSRSALGQGIGIERATVDLAVSCKDELDIVRSALPGRRIDLVVEGRTTGHFDASRIRESLANLVFNAARYSEPNSAIVVTLKGAAGAVTLAVENVGPAIAPELLPILFQPLRRGTPDPADSEYTRSNLGLGLFIVQEVANAHGGSVDARSSGGSTTFTMVLPSDDGAAPAGTS